MTAMTAPREDLLSKEELSAKFGIINYVVFFAMLLVSALIGVFYWYRGNKTTEDFLLASRSMSTLPMTLSLAASFLSAITLLGTPAEEDWPQDTDVLRANFINYRARDITEILPEIEPEARDLIQKMLHFDPKKRSTARQALAHPYFADQGPEPLSSPTMSRSSLSSNTTRSSDISSDSSMNLSHDTSVSDSSFSDKSSL